MSTQSRSPKDAAARKEKLFNFLDQHRDDVKYSRKGYKQRVLDAFEQETGIHYSVETFGLYLSEFRKTFNCPLQYCENKYYTPKTHSENKRVQQGFSTPFAPKETPESERSSPDNDNEQK